VKKGKNRRFAVRGSFVGALLLTGGMVVALSAVARTSALAGQSAAGSEKQEHPEFPAGDGRDVVLRLCAKCHSPNIILASGQDRKGWENTITKMARLGATGTDEDYSDIADYLTANFPPTAVRKVFVNTATDKQIAEVLEIGMEEARSIVAYRDKIKGFKSIDEMKQAPGADAKKIEDKKDRLVFGAAAAQPAS
jgi:competence protein ComEA